jgi:hypothetical protein
MGQSKVRRRQAAGSVGSRSTIAPTSFQQGNLVNRPEAFLTIPQRFNARKPSRKKFESREGRKDDSLVTRFDVFRKVDAEIDSVVPNGTNKHKHILPSVKTLGYFSTIHRTFHYMHYNFCRIHQGLRDPGTRRKPNSQIPHSKEAAKFPIPKLRLDLFSFEIW